jgi:hypothetical protein
MSLTERLDALRIPLPAGEVVLSDEGDGPPVYWLSAQPPTVDLWQHLHTAHRETALWPLLVGDTDGGEPWSSGEVYLDGVTSVDDHDPADVLAAWWAEHTEAAGPYTRWPGFAPAPEHRGDPDRAAGQLARDLLSHPNFRLCLVAAGRSADVLAVSGWDGPVNYEGDTAKYSAVVRTWEDRFGARVVALDGFAVLRMSVGAPPTTVADAMPLAAEHLAFAPDNVWQDIHPLDRYAERLVDNPQWTFWWD